MTLNDIAALVQKHGSVEFRRPSWFLYMGKPDSNWVKDSGGKFIFVHTKQPWTPTVSDIAANDYEVKDSVVEETIYFPIRKSSHGYHLDQQSLTEEDYKEHLEAGHIVGGYKVKVKNKIKIQKTTLTTSSTDEMKVANPIDWSTHKNPPIGSVSPGLAR